MTTNLSQLKIVLLGSKNKQTLVFKCGTYGVQKKVSTIPFEIWLGP